MVKIALLDGYSLGGSSLKKIESLGELSVYDFSDNTNTVAHARGAEIIITNKVKIFKEEIDALPELKLICVAATGTNNVDTHYAEERGIVVRNVKGYSTTSVSEATFSFVLALLRQVPYYNDYVGSGEYAKSDRCFNLARPIGEVSGKKWGIIGMGAIGRNVAGIATAMGAEVFYHSTSGKNLSQGYTHLSLEELLSQCDIITIHAPLNAQTEGLIGADEFAKMKESAIIVNVGRGGIIDEESLANALNENKIAGAALDVFTSEPVLKTNPLLSLKDPYKFIAAPHCGWASGEARETLIKGIAQNIIDFLG